MLKKWDFYLWDKYMKLKDKNILGDHNRYQKGVKYIIKDFQSLIVSEEYKHLTYYKLSLINQ